MACFLARKNQLRFPPCPPRGGKRSKRLRPVAPHWYLDLIGVEPELQAQGRGAGLLGEWLARVDADSAASYLETDRAENRAFYERHGFDAVAEERILGVPVWRMWREARGCAGSRGGEPDVR